MGGPSKRQGPAKQVQIGADGHRLDVFRDADGSPRCNSRKSGKPGLCKGRPLLGSKRCRQHGGLSPKGPASPSWKHGGRSSWRNYLGVPTGKGDEYLNLREGIEAQAEVLRRVAERLSKDDSPSFRLEAQRLYGVASKALMGGDLDEALSAMEELRDWIDSGVRADTELQRMSSVAAKLSTQVEGAHRARASTVNSMNAADALSWVVAVVNIVENEVGSAAAERVFTRINREVLSDGTSISSAGHRERDEPRVIEASAGEVAP